MEGVGRFFLPKQRVFFKLLVELAEFQKEIGRVLMKALQNRSKLHQCVEDARDIEHQADKKAHEIMNRLNKTFITPIDREDLYILVHELDDIVDEIENLVRNLELYDVESYREECKAFGELICRAGEQVVQLFDQLEHFKKAESLMSIKLTIHSLEDEGDVIYQKAIQNLFKSEKNPIELIKWKDLLENMEHIMDEYQKLSDTVEGVVVKSIS